MFRIHPIILLTIVGALGALSLKQVKFSASLYEMLPQDLPEVQGMDRLNRHFSRDGQLIVTMKAEEAFVAEEALASLAAHLESEPDLVSEVFRELSLTELVTEGGGLLAWLWLNGGEEKIAALKNRLAEENSSREIGEAMQSIQSGFFDQSAIVTSYDPLGFSKLNDVLGDGAANPDAMASDDGTFQVMYVEGAGIDFSDYRDAAVWLEKFRALVTAWEAEWRQQHPNPEDAVLIGLTGTPAFMAEVGAEMERDMTVSVVLTMLLISLLFWIMHRKTRPLSWLIAAMLITLIITVTIGGFVFGDLSVMSVGFAAILLGLAVDYGIVIYREAMDSGDDARSLRKKVGPGILWAAATTAVVFLSLNLSSLPGLSEMGNLVAIGVVLGALVMLFFFAPVAVHFNNSSNVRRGISLHGGGVTGRWADLAAILVPVLAIGSMFGKEMPGLEANFHPFRIRESPSMVAWNQLQSELTGRENAIPTVITSDSLPGLIDELEAAEARVEEATEQGLLADSVLPLVFVPNPQNQKSALESIETILRSESRLLGELSEAGFSDEGSELAKTVFSAWRNYAAKLESGEYAQPEGKLAVWSIDRLFSHNDGTYAALATVKPEAPENRDWVHAICDENTAVASLGSLGTALNERMKVDLRNIFLPLMGFLCVMLAIVFRSWRDLVLALFCLFFSASALVILTIWTPLRWNSFNVCGLPLLFGTGLDFGIHMIFALRRCGGDIAAAREGIGKALVFCGTSSAIGFGSLATASAHGLASLGIVCAVGILINMLVAVWLLPRWYSQLHSLNRSA